MKWNNKNLILVLIFIIAAVATYLLYLAQIGYLNDDWYLMYAAHVYGANSFFGIYSVDRPMRALVMTPAYHLFGDNVLYYNLSALLLRVISALGFLWILRKLWPEQHSATFLAALLFFVYPGFLSQFNGIDYQSQMISLAAAMVSIGLSVKASYIQKPVYKILLFAVAVLLGWFYLGLVEYFLGFEVLRLAVFIVLENHLEGDWKRKLINGLRKWLPTIIIPVVFLTWRFFFFQSQRNATNVGLQLGQFTQLPLATGMWWLVNLFLNALDVTFLAWGVPLYQLSPEMTRLRDVFIALASATILIGATLWYICKAEREQVIDAKPDNWRVEAMWLGIAVVFAGLLPVILVNRQVDFSNYTRYALASSGGAALILTVILFSISSTVLRSAGLSLLLIISVFTHQANALKLINETASLRSFWWQVAWRAPQIEMDTALIANYPVGPIEEDYFVWGPANLIYYPDRVKDDQIHVGVTAIVLNKDSLLKVLSGKPQAFDNRRTIRTLTDYQKILVLTKPSPESCVQVIDGKQPAFSPSEEERIMLTGSFSDVNNIDPNADPHTPPKIVFGPEPPHGWCYFYEKAGLAIQHDDWKEALKLGSQVLKQDLVPGDAIEWLPFLQAYTRAGDAYTLTRIKRLMKNADPFVFQQTCGILRSMPNLSPDVTKTLDTLYCSE